MSNPFAKLLHRSGHLLGNAPARGRLYQIADYPGLVLSESPDDQVRGDVYRIDEPHEIWPELDEYEGCGPSDPLPHEFEREPVTAIMDSGKPIIAITYLYRGSLNGAKRIETGDFLMTRK